MKLDRCMIKIASTNHIQGVPKAVVQTFVIYPKSTDGWTEKTERNLRFER